MQDSVHLGPLIDRVAPCVHQLWIERLTSEGATSRVSHWGEEMMRPWQELSEQAREYNRDMVRAVFYFADLMSSRLSL